MFDDIQPVQITAKAAREIRHIMETKKIPEGYGLRLGVRGGGCGGADLVIGFDKPREADLQYAVHNIQVLIDKKHTLYLIGKQVDFYDGADARGFMFVEATRGVAPETGS
jgi:iron-sulfur cluster assembly protein